MAEKEIENTILSKDKAQWGLAVPFAHLSKNIWVLQQYRMLDVNTHKLTGNVFRVWDALYKQKKWEYNSPLIALTETKIILPRNRTQFGGWIKKNAQLKDIIKKGKYVHIRN